MGADGPLAGRRARPWCPLCRTRPGPDCPDTSPPRRAVLRAERARRWTSASDGNGPPPRTG